MVNQRLGLLFPLVFCFLVSCTQKRAELGSTENPIKFYFVPSVDMQLIEDTTSKLKAYMEKNTPYKFKVNIPPSFIAVVEAFGTGRADIAAINTYGYVLAHERYGAEARLVTVRFGSDTYRAQFLARTDSNINKVEDLNGKKLAFVDPSSVSGFLLPMKELKDRGIKIKDHVFAMRHDNVVTMIYQRQVDAGATFHSPEADGSIQDARRLVRKQFPDVEKKIKIIGLTKPIPNDPVVFRKDMPEDMKQKIIEAFIAYSKTEEGLEGLKKISSVTALKPISDKEYDSTRATFKELGHLLKEP